MDKIIEISHLSKSYGDIKAVNDLSFSVYRGELFAFLGVNGAGKSTTISIMCGQIKKDSGKIVICGKDTEKNFNSISSDIGVVFQNSVLDKALSVKDNLRSRAALYGITGKEFKNRLDELSELLGFEDILNRTVGKLSGGQRRRIDIARALLHKRSTGKTIYILDEPTTGLDPQTRQLLWSVITMLRNTQGLTVFLTTHYMEESADSDYVVILDAGQISAEGTPLELKNKYTGDFITLYGESAALAESLDLPSEKLNGAVRIAVPNSEKATELIIKNPDIFKDYEVIKGKMDDVFMAVTGKNLSGGDVK